MRPRFSSKPTETSWPSGEEAEATLNCSNPRAPTPIGTARNRSLCRRPPADSLGRPLRRGGRKTIGDTGLRPPCAGSWDDQLREFAELPSGGDNSYPGIVEISPSRAIVSWYSSHEKDASGKVMTAIYLADLETAE